VFATNIITDVEYYIGFAQADTMELSDVPLADGTYQIEARPTDLLWDNCRVRKMFTVTVAAGVLQSFGYPIIQNLDREIVNGQNTITWSVSGEYYAITFDFGLWLSEVTPVVLTGAPSYTMSHSTNKSSYKKIIVQTDNKYLAVAAYSGVVRGVSSELYLPWSDTALSSPINQMA
jgi:hypothetical protein